MLKKARKILSSILKKTDYRNERKVIAEILIAGNLNAKNISWTGLSERTQKLRDKEKNRRKTNREIANKKTSRDVHQRLKKLNRTIWRQASKIPQKEEL